MTEKDNLDFYRVKKKGKGEKNSGQTGTAGDDKENLDLYTKCNKKYLEIRKKLGEKYLPEFDRFYHNLKGNMSPDSGANRSLQSDHYKEFIVEKNPEFLDFGEHGKGPKKKNSPKVKRNFYISRNFIQNRIEQSMQKNGKSLQTEEKFLEKKKSEEYCDEMRDKTGTETEQTHVNGEAQNQAQSTNRDSQIRHERKAGSQTTAKTGSGEELIQGIKDLPEIQSQSLKSREDFKKGQFRLSKKKLNYRTSAEEFKRRSPTAQSKEAS